MGRGPVHVPSAGKAATVLLAGFFLVVWRLVLMMAVAGWRRAIATPTSLPILHAVRIAVVPLAAGVLLVVTLVIVAVLIPTAVATGYACVVVSRALGHSLVLVVVLTEVIASHVVVIGTAIHSLGQRVQVRIKF